MYGSFASVYDRLMKDVDYTVWAAHYGRLLALAGIGEGAVVLEAACGTGSLSLHLAERYHLLPSDLSEEMLSCAALKAREKGFKLTFLRQDMRRLSVHRPADALVCACDGVNYLLTVDDLRRFLRAANQALRPGGALAFDISSFYKLSRVLGQTLQGLIEDDISYIWFNDWRESSHRLHMQVTVFARRADSAWERIDETQTQRAWTREEIETVLRGQGFGQISCFGGMSIEKPGPKAERLHFLAVKQQEER
jgi:ubiquinone/menaquinone biosynthesis C-methylase UbiE